MAAVNYGTPSSASGSTTGPLRDGASKSTRNDLSLKLKYEVVKTVEREKGKKFGLRKLAVMFGCGKTQISTILKNKEKIKELYEGNASDDLYQTRKRVRQSKFSDVNEALYEWFCLAMTKNVFPDGRILCEKAKEIADQLGVTDFKATNGWLDRWKKRRNIKQMKVSGESGDVSGATVQSWKERLPHILEGYNACDIWNLDETGCFWRTLPDKGLCQRAKECKGDKKCKQRITVTFIVNAAGGSEVKPVVIWTSENPRCFKRVDKSQLLVLYYSQKKAWMTGEILHDLMTHINRQLRAKGRSVLLLMDNAGCHPENLAQKYTNIKIVFLPPNTTSVLQPLDLGIIQNFKTYYRKYLFRYVVAKIEECTSASEVTKSLTILNAIRWVAEAWKAVLPETVQKCFRKAGILTRNFEVVQPVVADDSDPFADLDSDMNDVCQASADSELSSLIYQLQYSEDCCQPSELLLAENELPVCSEFADENWDEQFMAELGPCSSKDPAVDEESEDEDHSESLPQVSEPTLKSFQEAMGSLEHIYRFLEHKGCTSEATSAFALMDRVAALHCSAAQMTHQTTITDYFSEA